MAKYKVKKGAAGQWDLMIFEKDRLVVSASFADKTPAKTKKEITDVIKKSVEGVE